MLVIMALCDFLFVICQLSWPLVYLLGQVSFFAFPRVQRNWLMRQAFSRKVDLLKNILKSEIGLKSASLFFKKKRIEYELWFLKNPYAKRFTYLFTIGYCYIQLLHSKYPPSLLSLYNSCDSDAIFSKKKCSYVLLDVKNVCKSLWF